jgi:biopolymer transport protein ExbD
MRAVIRADADANHGAVMHALDVMKQAGLSRIALGALPAATK